MEHSFGIWVKRRRKAMDLTQQELAHQVGCSLTTIVKIESDERRPSRQIAELLARQLDIPADQRQLFLKIARQQKTTDTLREIQPSDQSSLYSRKRIQQPPDLLIGREFELAEISRFLLDPRCRLLTLTGTGGIGKTRLATQAALQAQNSFSDGGIFIQLAPLNGRDQMVTAIADTLGIVLYNASDRSIQLISHLRDKELLLVLDNFEHLLDLADCISLPGDILKGAPSVKLLVTSREPLQLQAEWVFEVRGLPLPTLSESDEFETSSAVKLFVQRARQARVDFELAAEDRLAVKQICQLVDGTPLAIELAAPWTRTLSCTEIAKEIQSNINFLATSARDVSERHRSIRATFDYSWKLLSNEEQHVLKQLSIFKGGFTREAAEQVAGATLPLLSALVSKSLLHRMEQGRYDLHELVRQYSLEYLKKVESEYLKAQDLHCEYFASLLERRGDGFKGMDHPVVAAELIAEIANLRQAWYWASERRNVLQVSRAADTLFWLYEFRCDYREGVPLFGYAAQCLTGGEQPPSVSTDLHDLTRARVMAMQGFVCLRQGQHPQSRELLRESLAILRSLIEGGYAEAQKALPYTLAFLGMVTAAMGDHPNGTSFLREALVHMRANHDRWGLAISLRQLGLLAYYQGEYDESYTLLSESLDVSRTMGNDWSTAYSLGFLGTVACARGANLEAENLLQEGLAFSKKVGDRFTTAYALNGLGLVKMAVGEHAEAQRFLGNSIAIWREIGDDASLAQSLNILGDVLLEIKSFSNARTNFIEALSVAKKAGLLPTMLDSLLGEARLRVHDGEIRFALTALAHIIHHPASTQGTKKRAQLLYSEISTDESAAQYDSLHKDELGNLVNETLGKYASSQAVA